MERKRMERLLSLAMTAVLMVGPISATALAGTTSEASDGKSDLVVQVDGTYTVKFDANGGEGTMDPQSFAMNEEKALSPISFKRVGYEFAGWNTAADGSGTPYKNNHEVMNLTGQAGATVTLYAQWEKRDPVKMTYYDVKGGKKIHEDVVPYFSDITYWTPDASVAPVGKTFQYWVFVDDTGYENYAFNAGEPQYNVADDQTYYGEWKTCAYTVKFDANEGKGEMDNLSFTYDEEKALTKNVFTREGYVFTGWNTQTDGKGTAYADEAKVKNLTSEDGTTVILYAQWKGANADGESPLYRSVSGDGGSWT